MKNITGIIAMVLLIALEAGAVNTTSGGQPDSPATLSPATTSLSGRVLDLTSGESLAGVEVEIEGAGLKTYTDLDGNFRFDNIKSGTYNIVASFISYNKSLIENLEINEKHTVDIRMESSR
jgi:hypothetical protein